MAESLFEFMGNIFKNCGLRLVFLLLYERFKVYCLLEIICLIFASILGKKIMYKVTKEKYMIHLIDNVNPLDELGFWFSHSTKA